MKKSYIKPDIMFDSFSMCGSVASCEINANFQENSCGVKMTADITLFTEEAQGCSWKVKEQEYDGLCYHVPFESYNVFGS